MTSFSTGGTLALPTVFPFINIGPQINTPQINPPPPPPLIKRRTILHVDQDKRHPLARAP